MSFFPRPCGVHWRTFFAHEGGRTDKVISFEAPRIEGRERFKSVKGEHFREIVAS